MESPLDSPNLHSRPSVEHPLAACALIACLLALGMLAVRSQPSEISLESTLEGPSVGDLEVAPDIEPDRQVIREAFYQQHVVPKIAETDQRNREAAQRCVERLRQLMDHYRGGIDPFVEDLTSISTRLGIVRRMPADWWKQDGRIESYIQQKFEHHLFSQETLVCDISNALSGFRTEVDANQKRMLVSIRASLDTSDLPEIQIDNYEAFLASVSNQLQSYSAQQGTTSVQNALSVLVLSEAGSYAAMTLASGLLARLGSVAATTAATAGGATAGASAAGAGGGSLGGPVGTAVGLGVGLVIGLAIDWWMTERFEDELSQKMQGYLSTLEDSILYGASSSKTAGTYREGIGNALPIVCDRLLEAYQVRFRDQIVHLEHAS